jgi:hypothetical protein
MLKNKFGIVLALNFYEISLPNLISQLLLSSRFGHKNKANKENVTIIIIVLF